MRRFRPMRRARRASPTFLPLVLLAVLSACAPKLQELGPLADDPSAQPGLDPAYYQSADGLSLPVRAWLPDGAPRAIVVALHGFNDYSNAFAEPGAYLASRGIGVYAYDQRGFGDTPQRGVWPGTASLVNDLGAMAELLRARYPGTPLYLLGESMGGAVAIVAVTGASPPPHDGVILAAPAVWGRRTMPAAQAAGLDVFVHVVPWLPVSGKGLKRHPSDNIEMLRALGRDPMVIKEPRFDTVYGLVNLMDEALEAAARLDGRTLVMFGANEDIIPREPIDMMLRSLPEAGAEARRIAIYPTGYHMLLRDLEAETVLDDIVHWIDDPAAPLPSGADRVGAERLAAARAEAGEK